MAPPRLVVSDQELLRLRERGLTHAQIAEESFRQTGNQVSRSTISVALHRAGATKDTPRYKTELPWRVKNQHLAEYPARMLRLLGRRRLGNPLTQDESKRLNSWLDALSGLGAVVAYCPDRNPGFLYVEADEVGDGENGVPIRRRTVQLDEIAS